ncbi:MAG TPA: Asp23/Gls24 family envelope stress response protein [Candidatus Limnocylindrales bacterium]|nr:Asp23/Gls24 family envelope stress response protein [Candidatus Limnocylindrales bacterium]
MPTSPTPGRSIVTRRAVVDMVRTATLGSYGVTGFAGGVFGHLLERLGLTHPGIRVTLGGAAAVSVEPGAADAPPPPSGGLTIDLDLTVAYGVPVAEVARQVDSAVRYAIRRALGREVERLTIHVDGLRYRPGDLPAAPPTRDPAAVGADDLAASGTDVG